MNPLISFEMHKRFVMSLRTFYTVQMNSFLARVSEGELTDYKNK